jgi:lipopolysaccharide transport system ATP-binding protein
MNIIEVEKLSKKFKLGVYGGKSLRDDFSAWLAKIRGKENPLITVGDKSRIDQKGEFLALQDINFNVKQGEVLGIIGKNGAGKSTLLKLLSRISYPTIGEIRIKGRIASLLEVGTGFHPELTGRENIFLNGAILGMTRNDITKKFDEIVSFSGIEFHIDTPVKRYSSGMKVRLGFAVAAHLEPEILVVDEVLAVGDAEFQRKSIGKMKEVSVDGRTILFVSHNMTAVKNLCSRVLVLDNGRVVFDGPTDEGIEYYINLEQVMGMNYIFTENDNLNLPGIKLNSIAVNDSIPNFSMKDSFEVKIKFNINPIIKNIDFTLHLTTIDEQVVLSTSTSESENIFNDLDNGEVTLVVNFPGNLLNSIDYQLSLLIVQDKARVIKKFERIVKFKIEDIKMENRTNFNQRKGVIHPFLDWKLI